jgi:uncharacterized protein (TIGR04222 family)
VTTPYLVSCALLLVLSVGARALPVTPRVAAHDEEWFSGAPLDPRAIAFLRRGTYGVVLTALSELHARGAVDASQRVRQVAPLPPSCYDDAVLTAVYAGVGWCTEPRLVALLPRVRRAVRPLRPALVERGLLVPVRRHAFGLTLLGYAAGLAVAGVVESGRQPSTVVGAVAVLGLAGLAAIGPRRTVAGQRVLRAERRLLVTWVGVDEAHPEQLLAAMVAAYGRGALELLCARFVGVGALAPKPVRLVPALPVPAPRPTPITIRIAAPRRSRVPAGPPVYEAVSDGPAIRVRPAFRQDRVAA